MKLTMCNLLKGASLASLIGVSTVTVADTPTVTLLESFDRPVGVTTYAGWLTSSGWSPWGSLTGPTFLQAFIDLRPSEGVEFLGGRMETDNEGDEWGISKTFHNLPAGAIVSVDLNIHRLEETGSAHIDEYSMLGYPIDGEGNPLTGAPLVFAQGTTAEENYTDWQPKSVIMPVAGDLHIWIHMSHVSGNLTIGKRSRFILDNLQMTVSETTPVPLPLPALLFASGLGLAGLLGVRRPIL